MLAWLSPILLQKKHAHLDLVFSQLDRQRVDQLADAIDVGGADDGSRDVGPAQDVGASDL